MALRELDDPNLLDALNFKGRVFLETTENSIGFIGDNCFLCDSPWTVKLVDVNEVVGDIYLCDEHLKHAKVNWKKRDFKVIKRDDIILKERCLNSD